MVLDCSLKLSQERFRTYQRYLRNFQGSYKDTVIRLMWTFLEIVDGFLGVFDNSSMGSQDSTGW